MAGKMDGMVVAEVEALAKKIDQQVEAIGRVVSTLDPAISGVSWNGKDADKFRQEWNSQLKSQLKKVSESLRQTSSLAKKQAKEQESTSSK